MTSPLAKAMQSEAATTTVAAVAPRLLIAAAQPYQTVAGPALSVSFLRQPQLLPFQRLPFTHSSVAPFYFHALLHTLAEFAETPRTVRHSLVQQVHAPAEDFWRRVGTLNRFSCTIYEPTVRQMTVAVSEREREGVAGLLAVPATGLVDASLTHPSMGAVELSRTSHRAECDVRLTLYQENFVPLAAMLMSGPDESVLPFGGQRRPRERSHSRFDQEPHFLSLREEDRRRKPLPALPLPGDAAAAALFHQVVDAGSSATMEVAAAASTTSLREAEASLFFPEGLLASAEEAEGSAGDSSRQHEAAGGLCGPLVLLSRGGFAQRAVFQLPRRQASTEPLPDSKGAPRESESEEKGREGKSTPPGGPQPFHDAATSERTHRKEAEAVAVPPWALHALVADLCAALDQAGHLSLSPNAAVLGGWKAVPSVATGESVADRDGPTPKESSTASRLWWVCAFDVQQSDDAIFNTPIDLVIAPPKTFPASFRIPAWRQRIGEPALAVHHQRKMPAVAARQQQQQAEHFPQRSPSAEEAVCRGETKETAGENCDASDGCQASATTAAAAAADDVALVALRLEARQSGRVFLDGTFYCRRSIL